MVLCAGFFSYALIFDIIFKYMLKNDDIDNFEWILLILLILNTKTLDEMLIILFSI